jgi:hypothetical protein
VVGFDAFRFFFFFFFLSEKSLSIEMFDSYTLPVQQLYNTPSHGMSPTHWASPPCEGVLCNCCGGVVNPSFSFNG